MLLNALFARKEPYVGIKKMKLVEYTGNARSVNEFIKKKEDKLKMRYIESPEKIIGETEKSLFLAGGITGTPDWQQKVRRYLKDVNVILFNPRRKDFPIGDPTVAKAQIKWEYEYLRKASMILFWFPEETLCPIVLYELGAWSMTDKKIFVGIHPEYKRRQDVEIQTKLVRPFVNIVYDLGSLSEQVISECK